MPESPAVAVTAQGYTWRGIWRIALRHRRELFLAHLIGVSAALLGVPIPLLLPLMVDEVLLHQPAEVVGFLQALFPTAWHGPLLYLGSMLLLTLLLRMLSLALSVWETRQFTIISKDVVFRIRRDLVARLERVSMAEYETLGSGKVNAHLVTDLDTVDQFIGASVSKFVIAVLSIMGVAAVLLWMHWQLALFILCLNPLVIYFTLRLGRRVKNLKRRHNEAYSGFQQRLAETLESIQQLRAYNRERYYLGRIIQDADSIRRHAVAYEWKTDAANRLSFGVFLLGFDTFRTVSMLMVVYSDLSVGQMFAVFGYLWFMMGPVQEVLSIQYAYHSAKAALARINELYGLALEPRYPHRFNPFRDSHGVSVQVENLRFAYDRQNPVLDGLSLHVAAGEKVALVGASGGGKTTLVQILLGLYPAQGGQVYFNGIPIDQIGLDVVRENVVTVLQHPALFNDSLRMNLTLGRDLPDAQLWRALEVAQLKELAQGFEQGLDTVLGRNGVRLSGGQRQRVAVARMVLADPKVVILDEATSALDTHTETQLHQSLQEFLQHRTTLIIAHRLSAVKQADRVLVFDQGRVIEQGRHEHLLQNNGVYAKLYGGAAG